MSRSFAKTPFAARPAGPPPGHIVLRKGVFLTMAGLMTGLGVWSAASVSYVLLRDEALHAIGARQAKVERAYDDRVDALRRELEKVNSQRALEEAAVDARVRELAARQSQIETRTMMLAALAGAGETSGAPLSARTARAPVQPGAAASAQQPTQLNFAPIQKAPASPALDALQRITPKKDDSESARAGGARPALRGAFMPGAPASSQPLLDIAADAASPRSFAGIVTGLERVEQMQIDLAGALGQRARRDAIRMEALAAELGLRPERLLRASPPASSQGGPFVAQDLDPDNSRFDREVLRHQDDLIRADRLRRALSTAPLGRPVSAHAEQTSAFGSRIDPFLGRPAHHTGIDFREQTGAPVFATAPGKVISAGPSGGYGLMVEIDHGNGITTRYAHLSAILVAEDQAVAATQTIGRVGSTGRSTGPHLHYEVRVDDDPVDPARFVRAGERLASVGVAN